MSCHTHLLSKLTPPFRGLIFPIISQNEKYGHRHPVVDPVFLRSPPPLSPRCAPAAGTTPGHAASGWRSMQSDPSCPPYRNAVVWPETSSTHPRSASPLSRRLPPGRRASTG